MNTIDSAKLVGEINAAKKSLTLKELDAYIAIVDDMRGVAIECGDDIVIDESFNTIKLKSLKFNIDGDIKDVIYLYVKSDSVNEIFGGLASSFLNLEKRDLIKKDPFGWFDEWRTMVGETKKNKMVYDLIGEMTVLLDQQLKGKNPSWDSINNGTFDISTANDIYEVKTSTNKYEDCVTIHSQFQLNYKKLNKPLYIAFVKVEKNADGESIESLYKKLVDAGFSQLLLDLYLDNNGYQKGKKDRITGFMIHEIRYYLVDESFPAITENSFIGGKIPSNVTKYEYTVSLSGLAYEKVK